MLQQQDVDAFFYTNLCLLCRAIVPNATRVNMVQNTHVICVSKFVLLIVLLVNENVCSLVQLTLAWWW